MSIALRCFVRLQGYRTVSSCGARPFPPILRTHTHKLGVPFVTMNTGARSRIRDTLLQDEALLVCQTCGMQYDHSNPANLTPPNACPVCEDDRQYVPEQGQKWTTMSTWLHNKEVYCKLLEEPGEPRIRRISPSGISVGIGQTPIVILTIHGIVIWDCCAVITNDLIDSLQALRSEHGNIPLIGIAISHPHFYTTALSWAKALDTKVFVSAKDRQWWMRKGYGEKDTNACNPLDKHIKFFEDQEKVLAAGLTVVRCGGHFDGSCVLHWDREKAPGVHDYKAKEPLATSGVVFCADTFAPGMDHKTITFMWSYPNFIPLPPKDVLQIWKAMKPFNFEDIIGGWPGRFIHGNAREKLLRSAKRFIAMEGHDPNVFDWQ